MSRRSRSSGSWGAEDLDLAESAGSRVLTAGLPGDRKPVKEADVISKPTVQSLCIELAAQEWQRSGAGGGAIEIAFVREPVPARTGAGGAGMPGAEWVLMRVAGDPAGRVLVYDRHEWECFLDGVGNGEFDDAVG